MMSQNHELENQDLRPTTMQDDSDTINLPGEELPQQDLDAVSGGVVAVLPFADELEDAGDAVEGGNPSSEPWEDVGGPVGDIMDAPELAENAIDNLGNIF